MAITFGKKPELSQTATGLCVVGNLTIDVILRGVATLPEWGQETLSHDRTESVAGQAGNVAFAASAMGVATDVIGAVGDDATGTRIRAELSTSGIGVDGVSLVSGGTTAMTIALVRPDGERAFVSDLGSIPGFDIAVAASQRLAARPTSVVAVVGTSNIKDLNQEAMVDLLRVARRVGVLTIFDPGWDPLGWPHETVTLMRAILAETDVFLPNMDEARMLTGTPDLQRMFDTFAELCAGTTVVKAGASGSYVVEEGQIVNVHSIATFVDNAVGAGDVFDSGVIAGYLNGDDLLATLKLASAAASLYIGRRENRFPVFQESSTLANQVEVEAVVR
jgi:sugar/nucleoside kinase (ribokinase family)